MTRLDKAEIHDAGVNKPEMYRRKVRDPENPHVPTYEQFPAQKHTKWVDAHGNVCFLQLVNGAGTKRNDKCEKSARVRIRHAGGLVYSECPLRSEDPVVDDRDFPAEMQAPCLPRDEMGNRNYGYRKACPHVEHVIAERRKAHAAEQELINRKVEAVARREAEAADLKRKEVEALQIIAGIKSAADLKPDKPKKRRKKADAED